MTQAARHLKGEAAEKVLREAMAANDESEMGRTNNKARIAALASALNPRLGEEFFESARKEIRSVQTGNPYDQINFSHAEYAFYRATVNPAESRLLLEEEWGKRMEALPRLKAETDPGSMDYHNAGISSIARAMIAVDPKRALEMMGEANTLGYNYDNGRKFVLRYLMSSEEERRGMIFQSYFGDED